MKTAELSLIRISSFLGQIFETTLRTLRYFGAAPVIFETQSLGNFQGLQSTKNTTSYKSNTALYIFQFSRWSRQALYSLIIQIFIVLSSIYLVYNVVSGNAVVSHYLYTGTLDHSEIPITNKSSTGNYAQTFGDTIMAAYVFQYYSCGTAIMLTTFYTAPNLVMLINRWIYLYGYKFCKAFPNTNSQANYKTSCNFGIFYNKLDQRLKYVLFLIVLEPFVLFYTTTNCFKFRNNPICTETDYWVSLVTGYLAPLIRIQNHLKLLLSGIMTLVVVVAQTHIKLALKNRENIENENYSWNKVFSLVRFVRRQYQLGLMISGPVHLILAAGFFASGISNWIIVMWLLKGYIPLSMVAISQNFFIMDIFTFWVLVKIDEKVMTEEKKLLEMIVYMTSQMSISSNQRLQVARNMLEVSKQYLSFLF